MLGNQQVRAPSPRLSRGCRASITDIAADSSEPSTSTDSGAEASLPALSGPPKLTGPPVVKPVVEAPPAPAPAASAPAGETRNFRQDSQGSGRQGSRGGSRGNFRGGGDRQGSNPNFRQGSSDNFRNGGQQSVSMELEEREDLEWTKDAGEIPFDVMVTECGRCKATYVLPADLLGDDGRRVKCSVCPTPSLTRWATLSCKLRRDIAM